MFTTIKNSLLLGTVGLFSLGSLAYTKPSQAASVNFSSWQQAGDVVRTSSQVTLTNAVSGDDVPTNFNISGTNPLPTGGGTGSLEAFLGLPNGTVLPGNGSTFGSQEGSAIRGTVSAANAEDVLRLTWNFSSNERSQTNPNNDYAFVTINGVLLPPVASISDATTASSPYAFTSGNRTFTYSLPVAGNYDVGIGIVDVNDTIASSRFIVSNASVEPVPEPITIVGSMMALGFGVKLRRRFGKKSS
jgi:hypothetical protein